MTQSHCLKYPRTQVMLPPCKLECVQRTPYNLKNALLRPENLGVEEIGCHVPRLLS